MVLQSANDRIFDVLSSDGTHLVVIGMFLIVPPLPGDLFLTTIRSTKIRPGVLHPELLRYAAISIRSLGLEQT